MNTSLCDSATAFCRLKLAVVFVFFSAAFFTSCRDKNVFDKELYREIVKGVYPVDTLEEDHPWTLLQRLTVSFAADIADNGIRELRVYYGHPLQTSASEVVAQAPISRDDTISVTFDVAQALARQLYAALVTSSGRHYVRPFAVGQNIVEFSTGNTQYIENVPSYKMQTFTYLYEDAFPMPEDFDYNDIVLRISRRVPQSDLLQLTVTLSAVGSYKQVAAALRLPGVPYDKVARVDIAGGKSFNYDYPFRRKKLDFDDTVIEGKRGDAVICLFEDAHWALLNKLDEYGMNIHAPYNTVLYEGTDTLTTLPEQTRTYNIYLKEGVDAYSLLLADLDPFIIERTNNVNLEVHTYKYKFEEVVWQFMGDDKRAYDDYLAWALIIPDGDFLYPVEEVPLGTYRNGELYGAYGRFSHSFGQWARNFRESFDWWQYPINTLVYH